MQTARNARALYFSESFIFRKNLMKGLLVDLSKRLVLKFSFAVMLWLLPVIYAVSHLAIWIFTAWRHQISWVAFLGNYDASWYNKIIVEGYSRVSLAFFPLYPLIIEFVSFVFKDPVPYQVTGTIFSFGILLAFLILAGFLVREKGENKGLLYLLPGNSWALFLFLFSPGSFIFHSHHTESLFLLTSFLVFLACGKKKLIIASILAGICALERNQGILVAVTAGFWLASYEIILIKKFRTFFLSGFTSFSIFLLYPLYQYIIFDAPFGFIEAQNFWPHVESIGDIFKTFFFANKNQTISSDTVTHHFVYWCFWISVLLLYKKNRWLAFYTMVSLMIMPFQGSLFNVYRFGSILFPALFAAGDQIGKLPLWVKIVLTAMILFLNYQITARYVLCVWPY